MFIALGAALVVVWFILRQLTAKPWETPGELATGPTTSLPPQRLGLWIFLAVVTSLFGLFFTAYYERKDGQPDRYGLNIKLGPGRCPKSVGHTPTVW